MIGIGTSSIARANEEIELSWRPYTRHGLSGIEIITDSSIVGRLYDLQRSDCIVNPNWLTIDTKPGTGEPISFVKIYSPDTSIAFFRVGSYSAEPSSGSSIDELDEENLDIEDIESLTYGPDIDYELESSFFNQNYDDDYSFDYGDNYDSNCGLNYNDNYEWENQAGFRMQEDIESLSARSQDYQTSPNTSLTSNNSTYTFSSNDEQANNSNQQSLALEANESIENKIEQDIENDNNENSLEENVPVDQNQLKLSNYPIIGLDENEFKLFFRNPYFYIHTLLNLEQEIEENEPSVPKNIFDEKGNLVLNYQGTNNN